MLTTFPPLASQNQYRAMRERSDHFFVVESQAPACFDIRNLAEIDPVVERAFGYGKPPGKFVNCYKIGRVGHGELLRRDYKK
jgi:hypothetical protein